MKSVSVFGLLFLHTFAHLFSVAVIHTEFMNWSLDQFISQFHHVSKIFFLFYPYRLHYV